MLAIVAAMILPARLRRGRSRISRPSARSAVVAAAGAALLLVASARSCRCSPPENEANPWKLIAAVPPQLRSQPVLNGYSMGGPLILSGIRPYIDGRGDMYGDELVSRLCADHRTAMPRAFDAAVQRWNIRWAILPNWQQAS